MFSVDDLAFLLTATKDPEFDLTVGTDIFFGVEDQFRSGYLERYAADATASLDHFEGCQLREVLGPRFDVK
jgi:hypothetical protein